MDDFVTTGTRGGTGRVGRLLVMGGLQRPIVGRVGPPGEAQMKVPCLLLVLATFAMVGCSKTSPTQPTTPVQLARVVEAARVAHRLPAIAAAAFGLDSVEVAASGIRRLGEPAHVTVNDLFHVGSLAKSLTATAIARLVDEGALAWTLTLADVFPESAASMDTSYRRVTLAELLQNRSGLPGINDLEEFLALPEFTGDVREQRQQFAHWVLAQPPAVPRGTYLYSTAGFSLAAAVAERRTGRSWESIVRESVLATVEASMFVGWPLEAGPNEPCGHMMIGAELQPVEPSAGHIPPVLAPGGDVSMTVRDFARYAQLHLRALCGRPELLSAAAWRDLHAPNGDYAMGWSVIETADNVVLTHTGSPETFFAFVVLYRSQRQGYVVIINATSPEVDGAIVDIITAMAPRQVAAVTQALATMRTPR